MAIIEYVSKLFVGRGSRAEKGLKNARIELEHGKYRILEHAVVEAPVKIGVDNSGVDVYKLVVEKTKGFEFLPGQGAKFYIPNKKLPKKETGIKVPRFGFLVRSRTLSFVSSSHEDHLVFIFKDQSPGRRSLFKKTLLGLSSGDRVFLREPTGEKVYPTKEEFENHRITLIAGGIGITPFLSILRHAAHREETGKRDSEKEIFNLLFINQTYSSIPKEMKVELEKYVSMGVLTITHLLTREKGSGLSEGDKEAAIREYIKMFTTDTEHSPLFYIAGGKMMTSQTDLMLKECGVEDKDIRCTKFGYED